VTTPWTPAADAALRTSHELGDTAHRQAQAVEAATGWRPSPGQCRRRAAALGLPPRPRGQPRRADAPRPTVTVTVDLDVLGVLAEVAAAAGVSPAQVAARVVGDWARAGQPDAWQGFAADVAELVASRGAADYARRLTPEDLPFLLDFVRERLAAGGAP
jgi:hypothetical protein